VKITRYGRFWAVYDGENTLVCLCVYKKGAEEVLRRLHKATPRETSCASCDPDYKTSYNR
jgi:hypothetical protein